MTRFYVWLDQKLFPAIVAYATHRLHVLALLALGVLLMTLGSVTQFELIGGNYTNITSALLACVILIQQADHHAEITKMHTQHSADLAALHDKHDRLLATLTHLAPKSRTKKVSTP